MKNLLKAEGFEIFKNYYKKDFECSRMLMIEGKKYLLRGFNVATGDLDEDRDPIFYENLDDIDLKLIYDDWLEAKDIEGEIGVG